jgi:hypothetical protein
MAGLRANQPRHIIAARSHENQDKSAIIHHFVARHISKIVEKPRS